MTFRSLLVVLASCVVASRAGAQSASTTRNLCRDPQRANRCRTYLLVELNAGARLAGTEIVYPPTCTPAAAKSCRRDLLGPYIAGDFGLMKNVDTTTSLGVSAQLGGSDPGGVRMALRGRYRRWLSNRLVIDAAAGPLMSQISASRPSGSTKETFGATGDVGIGLARIGLVTTGVDVARQYGTTAMAWHAGVRFESKGLIVGGAALVTGLIAVAAALNDGLRY